MNHLIAKLKAKTKPRPFQCPICARSYPCAHVSVNPTRKAEAVSMAARESELAELFELEEANLRKLRKLSSIAEDE